MLSIRLYIYSVSLFNKNATCDSNWCQPKLIILVFGPHRKLERQWSSPVYEGLSTHQNTSSHQLSNDTKKVNKHNLSFSCIDLDKNTHSQFVRTRQEGSSFSLLCTRFHSYNPGQKCWDTWTFKDLNFIHNTPSPPPPRSMLKIDLKSCVCVTPTSTLNGGGKRGGGW